MMVDYQKLIEEDRDEREAEYRGHTLLKDDEHTHVEPIRAVAGDNGCIKYIRIGNIPQFQKGAVYIQGSMMQELVNFIYQTFGVKTQ